MFNSKVGENKRQPRTVLAINMFASGTSTSDTADLSKRSSSPQQTRIYFVSARESSNRTPHDSTQATRQHHTLSNKNRTKETQRHQGRTAARQQITSIQNRTSKLQCRTRRQSQQARQLFPREARKRGCKVRAISNTMPVHEVHDSERSNQHLTRIRASDQAPEAQNSCSKGRSRRQSASVPAGTPKRPSM